LNGFVAAHFWVDVTKVCEESADFFAQFELFAIRLGD
jgi:hypothetical protein